MKPLPETPGLNIVFVSERSEGKPPAVSQLKTLESTGKPDLDYVEAEPEWYMALYQDESIMDSEGK